MNFVFSSKSNRQQQQMLGLTPILSARVEVENYNASSDCCVRTVHLNCLNGYRHTQGVSVCALPINGAFEQIFKKKKKE